MDLKEQIKIALGLNDSKEIKFEWQSKTEDGTILVSSADELETGVDISVLTEDGTTILLPIGTYKTDDVSFTVEEEGIVAEVMVAEEDEDVEEVVEEEMAKDDDEEKKYAEIDFDAIEQRLQNLEDAIANLKGEDKEEEEEVEEMAEENIAPGTNPKTITTKEVKEFSIEDLKKENELLKEQLAKSPADSPINAEKFANNKTQKLSKNKRMNLNSSERFLYDMNN